jgi:hypothetical protein
MVEILRARQSSSHGVPLLQPVHTAQIQVLVYLLWLMIVFLLLALFLSSHLFNFLNYGIE